MVHEPARLEAITDDDTAEALFPKAMRTSDPGLGAGYLAAAHEARTQSRTRAAQPPPSTLVSAWVGQYFDADLGIPRRT